MSQRGDFTTENACVWCASPAVYTCAQDGVLLCKEHGEEHLKNKKDHALRHGVQPPANCREHEQELKMFCLEHRKLLCVVCCDLFHTGHQLCSMKEAFQNEKSLVEELILEGKYGQQLLQDLRTQAVERSEEFSTNSSQVKQRIEEHFEALRCSLNSRQKELLHQIEMMQSEADTAFARRTGVFDIIIEQLSLGISQLKEALEEESMVKILMFKESVETLQHQAKELSHSNSPNLPEFRMDFVADLDQEVRFISSAGRLEETEVSLEFSEVREIERELSQGKIEIVPKNFKGENIAHQVDLTSLSAEISGEEVEGKCEVLRTEDEDAEEQRIRLFVDYELTRAPSSKPFEIIVKNKGAPLTQSPLVINVGEVAPRGTFLLKWGSEGPADEQFIFPWGVVIGENEVYVSDNGNHRIQVFDLSGRFLRKWGQQGNFNGDFKHPAGMAWSNGELLVSELGNDRIQVFEASTGRYIRQFGTTGDDDGCFNRPVGVSVHGDLVFVTERDGNRVSVFNMKGEFVRKWGSEGSAEGQFCSPWEISVSSDGEVFVADTKNHRIQVFDLNGEFIRSWGSYGSEQGQFNLPYVVSVVDGNQFVLVSDGTDRIQVFNLDGTFVKSWGSKGDAEGQFNVNNGIACCDGKVYTTDHNNHRVQVFE